MLFATLMLLQPQGLYAIGGPPAGGPEDDLAAAPAEPNDFRVFWKEGLRMETADGSVKARLGGRIQYDYAYVGNNQQIQTAIGAPLEDGTAFRRSRVFASGTIRDHLEWKAQYDFASGAAAFSDVYVGFLDLPWGGNLRVGQYKEPFSLEELTSSNYTTFLERSLASTFNPARSTGAMWYGPGLDERVTWAVGVFRDSNAQGAQFSDSEWQVTGRVTGLPYYEDDGRRLLHLGAAASVRSPNGDMVQYRARPESNIAPRFVSTPVLGVEQETLFGAEAAFVYERFSVQGEYVMAQEDMLAGPDADFSGYYVQGSVFLTDDYRPYDRSEGVFTRVRPAAALYGEQGGCGAWEAKVRYSAIDLTDGAVAGGELADVTVGLNWYLDSNFRIMIEGIQADLDGVDSTQIAQVRFQVDW